MSECRKHGIEKVWIRGGKFVCYKCVKEEREVNRRMAIKREVRERKTKGGKDE